MMMLMIMKDIVRWDMTLAKRFVCTTCGRFVSYHAITKDHNGCFECEPNATLERQAEIRRCIA